VSFMDKFRRRDAADLPMEQTNPYLSARRSWNEHVGGLAASRRMWQLVAILSLLIVLAAVGGIIAIGSQSKFVPYVVKVDDLGTAVATTRADRAAPVDGRVVQAQVGSFIQSARFVTSDIALQRQGIFRVYSMLLPNDPATAKMNDWLNGNQETTPFARAATKNVTVEIASVIPQTSTTWQVDWTETERDRQGQLLQPPMKMRALVSIRVAAPSTGTTEQQIHDNPLGIYVQDYSWSRTL
jgi:type IV secretory pathway TrbF-like protein